ncbi:alanine racemase [Streptomyces odontomachi]|uniref:alanine racemase n=1 Tax=Streptomyces odontomachi TaxID=2944940 RepID=UPI00210E8822|nr:alanine racemase [Streptomyces sp. ODS25]
MFLDALLRRNRPLADVAYDLHRRGAIPPDTYVVDLDTVAANAGLLAAAGREHGVALWCVVKHLGRNPELIGAIARHLPSFAAIDAAEARVLRAAGVRPGNLGHLVQIPRHALPGLLAWRPEAVTVYDLAAARAVSAAALRLGLVQDLLVRVDAAAGTDAAGAAVVYPGQEGGVPLAALDSFAAAVERLPAVRIAGVTGFPCVRCDPATGAPEPTAVFAAACRAKELLAARERAGQPMRAPLMLSAPGATCVATIPLLAAGGASHGEPGHALTGTTPLHAHDLSQPERPAYVYVTEIAHTLADGRPALFGGGFYARSQVRSALLPRTGVRLAVQDAPAEHIDYYRLLDAPAHGSEARAGDTALLAFRTQIFVTRSTVAVVAGLAAGTPRLTGLYDARGARLGA